MPPTNKKNLDELLNRHQPGKLEVQRGQGYTLSVNKPDAEIEEETAPQVAPLPKPPTVMRESAKVDKELIKAYKMLAAQEGRKIYEVMEEALHFWLDFHKGNSGKVEK